MSETTFFERVSRFVRRVVKQEVEQQRAAAMRRKHSSAAFTKQIDWDWTSARYNRVAVVNALAAQRPNGAYLEIGCRGNATFDAVPMPIKVGVDPVSGGTVRKTSDEFFKANAQKFDLIFIDGLHTYDQVHKDVANALKATQPNSWIVMHDMLPRNWEEQHEPPFITNWVGGGWKVAFEMLNTEGLDFRIITIDHGVGVIRIEEPGVELKDLSASLSGEKFEYFYNHHDRLPLATWEEACPWLRS